MRSQPIRTLRGINRGLICCALLWAGALVAGAADVEEGKELFQSGNYTQCVDMAKAGIAERPWLQDWHVLMTQSLLTMGHYMEAQVAVSNAVERFPTPRMRWLAREVLLSNGKKVEADEMVNTLLQSMSGGRPRDAESLVALGRAALLKGLDPKLVLDRLY